MRFLARTAVLAVLASPAGATRAADGPSFRTDVAPLLTAKCLRCHSGARSKGGLDLSRAEGLQEGGASGAAVVAGDAARSRLYRYVADKKMPPRQPLGAGEIDVLRRWIDAGARWDGPALAVPTADTRPGADWWSFRPVRRPTIPAVQNRAWVRNPIDAFVLARLEAAGLEPAPEADRAAYVRRVSFDLTGLPPTPEEIDAFVSDRSPDAYERPVDRLLASPAYGERWGRHWLDVVRFGESHGYEMNTLRPGAWPYRDYVIRAFNDDRPFARFVLEQLAGDAVAAGDPDIEAATGFLVGGPHDLVGNATAEGQAQQRSDDLYDMVSTTGSAFLGLTINCARCHDHKFDPITQRDYYGLEAVFAGVRHAERPLTAAVPEGRRHQAAALRADLTALDRRIALARARSAPPTAPGLRPAVSARHNVESFPPVEARFVRFVIAATTDGSEPCIDELEVFTAGTAPVNVALASAGAKATASSVFPDDPKHRVEHLNDGRPGNSHSWISREPGRGWAMIELPRPAVIDRVVWARDREQVYADRLPADYHIDVSADGKGWRTVAGSADREPFRADGPEVRALAGERQKLAARLAEWEKPPTAYAGAFEQPGETHVLSRGDPTQPLAAVAPSAVGSVGRPLVLHASAPEQERRTALAGWIADPQNPLPPRVLVNRAWHYHFGQGIVRTPSDFGANGDRPSHPELLDWLAAEYLARGGRLKPIHRLIVLSSTYRQASTPAGRPGAGRDPRSVDAACRLLWRYPARRLEAEVIRDAVLQTSGALDRRMGGPGYHLWDYSGYVIVFTPKTRLDADAFRRMVYQFKPRTQQDATFGAFDCPDATQTTPRRNASTTALQALNLLNSEFVLDQAARFAGRIRAEAGGEPARQVERAFRLAFGRAPSPAESAAAERLVREHGLPLLCRTLFNANEFIFSP